MVHVFELLGARGDRIVALALKKKTGLAVDLLGLKNTPGSLRGMFTTRVAICGVLVRQAISLPYQPGFAHPHLLDWLNVGHNNRAACLFGLELDLVPGFEAVQHGGIFNLKHHGHAGHV